MAVAQTSANKACHEAGQEIFLFYKPRRPTLGPTQSPVQWVVGSFSGVKDRNVNLTARIHLLPSLRMSGAMLLLPPYAFVARTGGALLSQARSHNREKAYRICHVRPSVRTYQCGSHWTDFPEI